MIRPLVLWNVSPNSMINQLISMYISRFGARDMRKSFYCNINPISQCFSIMHTCTITFSDIRSLSLYASRYIAVPKLYIQRYKKKPDFLSTIWSQCQRGRSATPPSPHIYTSSSSSTYTRKALTTTTTASLCSTCALLPGLARPLSGSYKYFSPRFETSLSDSVTDESEICVFIPSKRLE